MFRHPRIAALVAALAAALALLFTVTIAVPGASAGTGTPATAKTALPVVFVHGFYRNTCPGLDVNSAMYGPKLELSATGWTGPLDIVSYYSCDQGGSRIGSDTNNTSIDTIAAQLATYIFNTYTARGQAVDIVAHSMGGLITRTALQQTAAHAAGFPYSLLVSHVVTFSTPFAGIGPGAAATVPGLVGTVQGTQVMAGSALIKALSATNAASTGGASWMVVGSSGGCDLVPGASAVAVPGAIQLLYTGCWSHIQYLTTYSTAKNFPATLNGTSTLAYGSLQLMRVFLSM